MNKTYIFAFLLCVAFFSTAFADTIHTRDLATPDIIIAENFTWGRYTVEN